MLYRIDFRAMGCGMIAMLDGASDEASDLLAQVPTWFEEWEDIFSRFRPGSELNQLNLSAGVPFQVSEALWDVFQVALDAEIDSSGLVRATVLSALTSAGYDRSFESMPSEVVFRSPWDMPASMLEIDHDFINRTICLPAGVNLDFGGIAKGWAAEKAAQRLAVLGPALVSAGGDISITDVMISGKLWPVSVDAPFTQDGSITTLILAGCGVATSGTDYRRWKIGGSWGHHIIDPRTGFSAATDVVIVTVVAPDAVQAEMAAKSALILGSRKGLKWIESHPEFSALFVLETGQIIPSKKMEKNLLRSL